MLGRELSHYIVCFGEDLKCANTALTVDSCDTRAFL